ncbi:MAG TPA: nitroreductase/quinone reductase family protein [Candidatus Dormibacteraeota bacterium]|jgi:deazaflavin-dependent oxidoreductase (nitroreductase family)
MSEQKKVQRPEVPQDINAFNQKVISEFRANQGRLSGQLAGRPLMLLTTRGVKSGTPRTVVLGFRPHGKEYVVIASANGAPSHPAWYVNLLSDPAATVEVGPEKFQARARTADPAERTELAALIEYLEPQQALTKREIPIVVLQRVP